MGLSPFHVIYPDGFLPVEKFVNFQKKGATVPLLKKSRKKRKKEVMPIKKKIRREKDICIPREKDFMKPGFLVWRGIGFHVILIYYQKSGS